ncbi:hypothetical protein GIY00_10520 [Klebsiella aerogenes]|nr:hypothetical protein GIY01_10270 [Klebsiella aerogenes]QGT28474.1 hypothetical protein GIY00_10520 [Klebsiella aerogenes]
MNNRWLKLKVKTMGIECLMALCLSGLRFAVGRRKAKNRLLGGFSE